VETDDRVSDPSSSDETTQSKKTQFALAVANGASFGRWARSNDVPEATAYQWASEPEVRRQVDSFRRRIIDEAIGRMTKRFAWVADQIADLAETADSSSVRVRALRATFADMIKVSEHFRIEHRLAEVEEKLDRVAPKHGHFQYPPTYPIYGTPIA
jgi:hypothetical protein